MRGCGQVFNKKGVCSVCKGVCSASEEEGGGEGDQSSCEGRCPKGVCSASEEEGGGEGDQSSCEGRCPDLHLGSGPRTTLPYPPPPAAPPPAGCQGLASSAGSCVGDQTAQS